MAVNSVRKHCSDEEVVASAKILIKNWKRLLGERGRKPPPRVPLVGSWCSQPHIPHWGEVRCVTPTPSPESSAPAKKEKDADGEKEKKEKEKRLDVPNPTEGANPHPAKHPKSPTEKHREKHKERCGIQCHRTRISPSVCQSGGCSGAAC